MSFPNPAQLLFLAGIGAVLVAIGLLCYVLIDAIVDWWRDK